MRLWQWISVAAFGVMAFACTEPAESPKTGQPGEPAAAAPAADRQLTLTYFTMPG